MLQHGASPELSKRHILSNLEESGTMNEEQSPTPAPQQEGQNGFEGVFSRDEIVWIGTGATRRKSSTTMHYYATSTGDAMVELRALNANYLPSGETQSMELDEFLSTFRPEPEIHREKTMPALRDLSKSLAKGDRLRSKGQPYSAEVAYKDALSLDQDNVRGNFGLGLTYLEQGKNEEAEGVLKRIVKLRDSFEPENKHMFNEFGIKLRKNGMYDQALAYYATAYKMSKNDEHLCFNIARTLLDKGDLAHAQGYLEKALNLRPDFEEAAKLLAAVNRKLAKG